MSKSTLEKYQRDALSAEAEAIITKALQLRGWMIQNRVNVRDPIWLANLRILEGAKMLRNNALIEYQPK